MASSVFDTHIEGLATAGVGSYVGAFVNIIASSIEANVAGDIYSFQQNSFYRNPQVPPAPQAILDCYNRGYIDIDLAKVEMRNNGVNWEGIEPANSARLRNHKRSWEAIRRSMQSKPSVEFVMSAWGRGFFDRPSDLAERYIKRAGGDERVWRNYVDFFFAPLPPSVAMEANLRGVITDAQFDESLKRSSFGHVWQRNAYKALLNVNPPATDWIHFAVKEALSPDVANVINLYDEFPQAISQYLGWQGLNWDIGMPIVADGIARNATIADLYWAAHWQPIAPTQAFGMRHILRPGRLDRYRRAGLNVTAFGMDDVRRWLRINDYPSGVRDNLAALSFNPLRLVDIRTAIAFNWRATNDLAFRAALPAALQARFDGYNRQWAIEQFLDRGVLPDDAETQVDIAIAQVVWAQQAPVRAIERGAVRRLMTQILNAYQVGFLPEVNARNLLLEIGLSNAAIDTYLSSETAKEHVSTAKTLLAAARKGMMSGTINETDYRIAMEAAGITPGTINANLARINSERDFNHIQLTTAKIVGLVGQGILGYQAAKARLDNLGWLESDSVLLLAEAASRNLKLQGQAIKAADASRQKRAKELEKALKQAQKNVEVLQAAIRRQTPISTLQRLVRKRIITTAQFLDRAIRMGYPPDIANDYLRDALSKDFKTSVSDSAQKPATAQSPQTPPPSAQSTPPVAEVSNETGPASASTSGTQVQRPATTVTSPNTTLPSP